MTPGHILIISDDPDFVRSLMSSWRLERDSPSITTVSTSATVKASVSGQEMVVVGPLRACTSLPKIPAVHPDSVVCAVGDEDSLQIVHAAHANWMLLPENNGWMKILFSVASEVLRRAAAEARAREAELTNLSQRRFGVLGKSLLEARPGMVNALTSLLGNADLILLSGEPLPDNCREHMRTIHTMALRLNEIVQRLSSVENEMELSERKSQLETPEMRMAGTTRP
jgi:hypothetical protein